MPTPCTDTSLGMKVHKFILGSGTLPQNDFTVDIGFNDGSSFTSVFTQDLDPLSWINASDDEDILQPLYPHCFRFNVVGTGITINELRLTYATDFLLVTLDLGSGLYDTGDVVVIDSITSASISNNDEIDIAGTLYRSLRPSILRHIYGLGTFTPSEPKIIFVNCDEEEVGDITIPFSLETVEVSGACLPPNSTRLSPLSSFDGHCAAINNTFQGFSVDQTDVDFAAMVMGTTLISFVSLIWDRPDTSCPASGLCSNDNASGEIPGRSCITWPQSTAYIYPRWFLLSPWVNP